MIDDDSSNVFNKIAAYKFVIMIASSIIIALILVVISMIIYTKSGAIQLDLSRPGYESVRIESPPPDKGIYFSDRGKVTYETFDEFFKLFDKTTNKLFEMKPFDGDLIIETIGKPEDAQSE